MDCDYFCTCCHIGISGLCGRPQQTSTLRTQGTALRGYCLSDGAESISGGNKRNRHSSGEPGRVFGGTQQAIFRSEALQPVVYPAPKRSGPETANLLSVHPGEPQTWHIYLTGYDLTLGEYRAVFDYWSGDGYFAFPFEIITEK